MKKKKTTEYKKEARVAIREHLFHTEKTQKWLAGKIPCSEQSLSNYLRKGQGIGIKNRRKALKILGIALKTVTIGCPTCGA